MKSYETLVERSATTTPDIEHMAELALGGWVLQVVFPAVPHLDEFIHIYYRELPEKTAKPETVNIVGVPDAGDLHELMVGFLSLLLESGPKVKVSKKNIDKAHDRHLKVTIHNDGDVTMRAIKK